MFGEDGDDNFFIGGNEAAGDLIDGGADSDDIILTSDTFLDFTTTFTSIERVIFANFDIIANTGTGFDLSGMTRANAGELLGQGGDEVISGTEGADTIRGFAGMDTLNGNAGNDTIFGGDGDDIINGGDGNDLIHGEAGADILNGGAGSDDFFYGGNEAAGDTVDGGADNDDLRLTSDLFLDFTTSFTNIERIIFGGFSITANTGTGFDLSGMTRSGISTLNGQGGAENITGTDSDDNIFAMAGDDIINGGGGADNIYGGEGADILNGGDGNDEFFVSGTESLGDVIDGGTGTDVIRLEADSEFNSANSFANITTFDTNGFNILLVSGTTIDFSGMNRIDGGDIIATAGNEVITGFDNADEIFGLAGDDIINGGGGNDLIFGGEGADILNGDDGNDDFRYGGTEALGDTIDGGAGSDDLFLTADLFLDFTTSFTSIERVVFDGFNVTANTGTGFDFSGMTRNGLGELLGQNGDEVISGTCLLYTSPSPRDRG